MRAPKLLSRFGVGLIRVLEAQSIRFSITGQLKRPSFCEMPPFEHAMIIKL
jgi:hypothetical protein